MGTKSKKRSRYDPDVPAKFERRVLTKAEAALFLGVTENWIEKACQRHQIPYRKVGGQRRFHIDDLDAYLEARKVPMREKR